MFSYPSLPEQLVMPHPRSLSSWEGKKKKLFLHFICSFLETSVEGTEILWEMSHLWDESKILSSHGDAVIAPGMFFMFKAPPNFFPGIAGHFPYPQAVCSPHLSSTNKVNSRRAMEICSSHCPGSLRIDPNTAQGCRMCIPRTKS